MPETTPPIGPELRALLRLVLDRLIPADERGPGALAVIGDEGISRALATARYATLAEPLGAWLVALREIVGDRTLTAAETDDLLRQIEAGQLPTVPGTTFSALVTLTAELYYGSPAEPDADGLSPAWRMLGYSPRPLTPPPRA